MITGSGDRLYLIPASGYETVTSYNEKRLSRLALAFDLGSKFPLLLLLIGSWLKLWALFTPSPEMMTLNNLARQPCRTRTSDYSSRPVWLTESVTHAVTTLLSRGQVFHAGATLRSPSVHRWRSCPSLDWSIQDSRPRCSTRPVNMFKLWADCQYKLLDWIIDCVLYPDWSSPQETVLTTILFKQPTS